MMLPLHVTVGDQFDQTVKRYPDRDAFVHVDRNRRYPYRELQHEVNRFAKGLMTLGLNRGDPMALWATNLPEWIITQVAAAKLGTPLIALPPQYQTEELRYALHYSETRTLILMEEDAQSNYLERLVELCPSLNHSPPGKLRLGQLPHLKEVIVISERNPEKGKGVSGFSCQGTFSFQDVLERGERIPEETLVERQRLCQPDDILNIAFTSGTTGMPKGIMITHHGFLNNGYFGTLGQGFTEKDRLCPAIPFHYNFTITGLLGCFCHGAAIISPSDQFDPLKTLNAIEKERCTAIYAVPGMLVALMEHPQFDRFDLSSLRTGMVGGAVIPIELMKRILEKLGAKEITISYGQSEGSGSITQTSRDDPIEIRATTVGKAIPFAKVKVVNPETGEPLPPGVQGELCYKGFLMKGYFKMPAATGKALDAEGWLHSGDVATLDGQGYVRIVGRIKDLILKDGISISPIDIEEVLTAHPKIFDAQVFGVPDPRHTEEVAAWIRLKKGERATPDEIIRFLGGRLPGLYHPRYIQFVSSFPMTSTGKIQRFKLREEAMKQWGLGMKSEEG